MRYKFGEPSGRYIGNGGKYHVYADSISEIAPDGYNNLPVHKMAPGEFNFQYGPSTGGLMESVGITLTTPGELINSVAVDPSYKARSLKLKGKSVGEALLMVERINGFHAASNSLSFLMAVEDALNLQVTEEVQKARILQLELERIRSNLEVIKRLCEPAGFGVPVNQLGYLREKVSRIISGAAGHRFFFGANAPGCSRVSSSGINEKLREVGQEFQRLYAGLLESKIFLNRLQNNGVTRDSFLIGPAARASGLRYDTRAESGILPYRETPFYPVVREEKDCFGRFCVRGEEILNSIDIIASLGNLKETEQAEATEGSGEGCARLESPQGDIFYYVRLKNGSIEDLWHVSPGTLNIRAFQESMKGNIFTDFHFNWESFGMWISEVGVVIQ